MLCQHRRGVYFIILDAEPVDHQNFKRFHSYAQYVETLEIYDPGFGQCYAVRGWLVLEIEKIAQGRPLTPNLRALRFLNTSPSHGIDESKWIQLFTRPGINEVSLIAKPPHPAGRIPFPVASVILGNLIQQCPGIRVLHFAPSDSEHYPGNLDDVTFDRRRFRVELERQPSQPWYRAIQSLTQLTHLTVSEGWLYPAGFHALGRLPELQSLTIVPGLLDNFDYMFDMDPVLLDGSFPSLVELAIIGLEQWGIIKIFEVRDLLHRIATIKLEFYFDESEEEEDRYITVRMMFEAFRRAPCLQELHICFPFQLLEEEERAAKLYDLMEIMGPNPRLGHILIDGMRIGKESRPSIRKLAPIWPNVQTLSMPSQHASLKDLENFAALPSLRHLTVKLNLEHPHVPEEPEFKCTSLETLASSGPVRVSTVYRELSLSAHALLSLWPSLQRVTWSDKDPARTQMADFFNSEILGFNREFMFGSPEEVAQASAIKRRREMKVAFKLIVEEWEEVGSDSDTDTDAEDEEGSGSE